MSDQKPAITPKRSIMKHPKSDPAAWVNKLRMRRERLGYSRRRLAQLAMVQDGTIADLELGKHDSTKLSTVIKLCAALRIPIGHLFNDQAISLTKREWQSLTNVERRIINCYRIIPKRLQQLLRVWLNTTAALVAGKKRINYVEYSPSLDPLPPPVIDEPKE